jgi:hypothetical protein
MTLVSDLNTLKKEEWEMPNSRTDLLPVGYRIKSSYLNDKRTPKIENSNNTYKVMVTLLGVIAAFFFFLHLLLCPYRLINDDILDIGLAKARDDAKIAASGSTWVNCILGQCSSSHDNFGSRHKARTIEQKSSLLLLPEIIMTRRGQKSRLENLVQKRQSDVKSKTTSDYLII